MLPTKFRFIQPSGFRREEFFKSANQKQAWLVAAIFVNGSKRNEQSLQRTFHRCFLPSLISFGQAASEENLDQKSTNKKQELSTTAMFVNGSKRNEQFPWMLPTTFRSIWPSCLEDFQISTNQKHELPVAAMFVNGSGQNEQSVQTTSHRCFLPSFSSYGCGFQRRRLKCEKLMDDRRRRTDAK